MTDPLKIAILGFWHVHARDYAARGGGHPDTEVVAVWDDDASRPAGADSFGVPFSRDLDGVCSPATTSTRSTMTTDDPAPRVMVRAAQAGKHIFTEKVLAPTVAEAEEIVAATDAHGVRLFVSLPRLYARVHAAIARHRRSGHARQLAYGAGPAVPRRRRRRGTAARAGCPSASSTRRPRSAAR